MTDPYRMISFEVCKAIFPDEVRWLQQNRYKIMDVYPDFLSLLSTGQFSHWHMTKIRDQMAIEAAEVARLEVEKNKVTRNPALLSGTHRVQAY
jgi:hypothetical protein